jgi:hypothetical protein
MNRTIASWAIASIALAAFRPAYAVWSQPFFVIGTWDEGYMTAQYQTGVSGPLIMSYLNAPVDPNADLAKFQKIAQAKINTILQTDNSNAIDTTYTAYKLDRAGRAGLKMLVRDDRISGTDTAVPAKFWQTAYDQAKETRIVNFYKFKLSGSQRLAMMGYLAQDEPDGADAPLATQVQYLDNFNKDDDTRIALSTHSGFYPGLPGSCPWGGQPANPAKSFPASCFGCNEWLFGSPQTYLNRLRYDLDHNRGKIVNFDYYPFYRDTLTHFVAQRQNYFQYLGWYARETGARGKNFWAGALLTQHFENLNGCGGVDFQYAAPTTATLRLGAYAPLVYGARGIVWYKWDSHPWENLCDANAYHSFTYAGGPLVDATLLANLTSVNNTLANMGPTLMTTKWLGAYHGSSTDALSGETGLPVLDANSPLVGRGNLPGQMVVGVFEGRAPYYYCLLLNKDRNVSRTATLVFKETNRGLATFDKANNVWTTLAPAQSITLTLGAADAMLIRVVPSKLRKYSKSYLN